MGAEQSKSDASGNQHGFHVLRVDSNSPAFAARLQPYFDYITSVNGVEVVQEIPNVVAEMAKNHVDRPMKMTVYNCRDDTSREVTIVPSRNWGGPTLLGILFGASIRYAQATDSIDRVWHVLDVISDSPAHRAGLVPHKGSCNWIIGSPEIAINNQDDFFHLMIHNQKRPVPLLVFNIDDNMVRETRVIPDFAWGGEGCLGCDVASGALHRIPPSNIHTTKPAPIEAPTSQSASGNHNYANVQLQPPTSNPGNGAPHPPEGEAVTLASGPNLKPIPGFECEQSASVDASFFS